MANLGTLLSNAPVPAAALTYTNTDLGSDVTMTTATTYYDGPSASFGAGTWLFIATAVIQVGGALASPLYAKVYYGSTDLFSGTENSLAAINDLYTITISKIVVLGSTQTVKLAAMDVNNNSSTLLKQTTVGTNITCTRLLGIQIA